MITITLNGVQESIEPGISISDYLSERVINPAHVVVELNRNIIQKEKFDQIVFCEGDTVEILRFVGGG